MIIALFTLKDHKLQFQMAVSQVMPNWEDLLCRRRDALEGRGHVLREKYYTEGEWAEQMPVSRHFGMNGPARSGPASPRTTFLRAYENELARFRDANKTDIPVRIHIPKAFESMLFEAGDGCTRKHFPTVLGLKPVWNAKNFKVSL